MSAAQCDRPPGWPQNWPYPGCDSSPTPTTPPPTTSQNPQPGGAKVLQFKQLKQEQDQWCWAASGLSIAQYLGKGGNVSQNQFCNLSRGYSQNGQCPNEAGYFDWVQKGYRAIGLGAGTVAGDKLSFDTVKQEIDGNRPIETGIYWTSGGGHAQVIYGYDAASTKLSYGDPWPQSTTYSEMSYQSYVSNGQFRWGDALYRIGQ
ncbi:hypothetical protein D5S17_13485 [Pseudonocardiaceae bacterium YIM PH 21723]|nr:hypothetical protein D5S17_13485 [Pseudonocardiaceae bacterium YIM PH 21723]